MSNEMEAGNWRVERCVGLVPIKNTNSSNFAVLKLLVGYLVFKWGHADVQFIYQVSQQALDIWQKMAKFHKR